MGRREYTARRHTHPASESPAGGRAPWHWGLMAVQLLPQDARAGGNGKLERQEGRNSPDNLDYQEGGSPGDLLSTLQSDPLKQETTTCALSALCHCPPDSLVRDVTAGSFLPAEYK